MANGSASDKPPTSPGAPYGEGAGETEEPHDAAFPPLDFPGSESLQGLPRRRLTPSFVGLEEDRIGALGTLGAEVVGSCVVVWQCVEESELFPGICNRWVPILIAC